VQGGLSTTMELAALRRPFVYFPLRRHWEQRHHVAHRLNHYRAGIGLDYAATTPGGPRRGPAWLNRPRRPRARFGEPTGLRAPLLTAGACPR
jgi:hypothetical protein